MKIALAFLAFAALVLVTILISQGEPSEPAKRPTLTVMPGGRS